MPRVPRSARAWLGRELAQWRSEGLVDERAAQELERRYGLAEGSGVRGALFAVYLVGSLLIAGGVLSFVGWNWGRLPAAAKLGLGAGALAAAYALGHWLAVIDGRRPLLGRSLVFLGSLLFGANIGIVAQVFQLDGEFWGAAGLWGAGAALAAWVLRCQASALLAAFLGSVWVLGRIDLGPAPWAPFVPAAVLLPLAFSFRSPFLFGAVAVTSSVTLAVGTGMSWLENELSVASALASASLLAALPFVLQRRQPAFAPVAGRLGMLGSVLLAYALSFHDLAEEIRLRWVADAWLTAILPQLAGVAACLAAVRSPRTLRERPSSWIVLGANALLFAGALSSEPEVVLTLLANLALCLLAGYGIAASVHGLERRAFWASVALIVLVVVSRFLEYETGLLTKAAVFTACGVAVLTFGLAFERRLGARKAGHA